MPVTLRCPARSLIRLPCFLLQNRELQIMGLMDHVDVISLKHCFYSKGDKPDEVYLNLVMSYVPETVHRTLRTYTKANKVSPRLGSAAQCSAARSFHAPPCDVLVCNRARRSVGWLM